MYDKNDVMLPVLCYSFSAARHWNLSSVLASVLFTYIYHHLSKRLRKTSQPIICSLWLSCAVYNTFASLLRDKASLILLFLFAHIFFSYYPLKESASHLALLIYCCCVAAVGFSGEFLFWTLSHMNIYYILTIPLSDLAAWWGLITSIYVLAAVEHIMDWDKLLKVYFQNKT